MEGKRIPVLLALCLILCLLVPSTAMADEADGMNMYQNSDFIEKEQPELSAETKWLIAQYQQEPNEESYLELREMVIGNYNAVLERKEDKLAELKTETAGKPGGGEIVAEMEALVQEMYVTYWDRINASMLRFTDPRLLTWKTSQAARYDYIPVMGAGESICIKRTTVTNAEYAAYLDATGAQAPSNWTDGTFPEGEEDYPVNCVSCQDAEAYCAWLTQSDGFNSYRLPSESEWELAAGHMPKDADFNCGVSDGRTPVEQYADVTMGAHGAVDFWGNVWEWTSTVRSESDGTTVLAVKGGSWASERTDCRTEYRGEGRDAAGGYEDVGFRVIQVLNGQEPAQAVEELRAMRQALIPLMRESFENNEDDPTAQARAFLQQAGPKARRMGGDAQMMILGKNMQVIYPRDAEERAAAAPLAEAFAQRLSALEGAQEDAVVDVPGDRSYLADLYEIPARALQLRYLITYCPTDDIGGWVGQASLLVLGIASFLSLVTIAVLWAAALILCLTLYHFGRQRKLRDENTVSFFWMACLSPLICALGIALTQMQRQRAAAWLIMAAATPLYLAQALLPWVMLRFISTRMIYDAGRRRRVALVGLLPTLFNAALKG